MTTLTYPDRRSDPAAWAKELGISRHAVELYLACEVVDLHLDSFIWARVFGYDLARSHGRGLLRGWFFGHADFPRVRAASIGGAIWSITTNPARGSGDRARAFHENLGALTRAFRALPNDFELARNLADYRRARCAGRHAAFIGVQGGNALSVSDLETLDPRVIRITLVHLTTSALGATSAPLKRRDSGLSAAGAEYVRALNRRQTFVDLAHIGPRGFWEAVRVHDRSQPLMVSHTGVSAEHTHWRNVDDAQIRAVADTGGVVGIIYHAAFLGDPLWAGRLESIVRHLEHVRRIGGDDAPSLGSDWDGAIVPPANLRSCDELPRMVQVMLDRGWSETQVEKTLGSNFLGALERLRG
ncbi:MAG TPA: membrane dipeptidase [Polyangiaceae bacterium]